jgi:hypothetical protein
MTNAPLEGDSANAAVAGVTGTNSAPIPLVGTAGFLEPAFRPSGGPLPPKQGPTPVGVLGQSTSDGTGVAGTSVEGSGVTGTSTSGAGVQASSVNGTAMQATSNTGTGIYARGQQYAAQFEGNVEVDGGHTVTGLSQLNGGLTVKGSSNLDFLTVWNDLQVNGDSQVFGNSQVNGNHTVIGTVTVRDDIVLTNSDCAEEFDMADSAGPGTVMVIGDDETLRPSAEPYDRRVAGVISGGGKYKPALLLDRRRSSLPRSAVALVGKVCCKVDAKHGPVKVGDLLTTSPTPGHAMRASDRDRAFGAVIGKALQPLESGQGLIPILVALQ